MSVVRCPTCGEIVDDGQDPYCWGCGKTLSGIDADDGLRLPPVMREARRDASRGGAALTALGVMVLGGLVATGWGWPVGLVLMVIIVAFTRSAARQNAADGGAGAAAAGVLGVVLRACAWFFIGGIVLAVGAFVFLYIACLVEGGGGFR